MHFCRAYRQWKHSIRRHSGNSRWKDGGGIFSSFTSVYFPGYWQIENGQLSYKKGKREKRLLITGWMNKYPDIYLINRAFPKINIYW